mmetsp:Transcript_62497/g.176267  ORF Transcript_62497/g.176267 Transcript_62497/m.176267 type:complete len:232 (-) Transcript_62497:547-1242(-)
MISSARCIRAASSPAGWSRHIARTVSSMESSSVEQRRLSSPCMPQSRPRCLLGARPGGSASTPAARRPGGLLGARPGRSASTPAAPGSSGGAARGREPTSRQRQTSRIFRAPTRGLARRSIRHHPIGHHGSLRRLQHRCHRLIGMEAAGFPMTRACPTRWRRWISVTVAAAPADGRPPRDPRRGARRGTWSTRRTCSTSMSATTCGGTRRSVACIPSLGNDLGCMSSTAVK